MSGRWGEVENNCWRTVLGVALDRTRKKINLNETYCFMIPYNDTSPPKICIIYAVLCPIGSGGSEASRGSCHAEHGQCWGS